jgi:NADH pyrophosphatase NudC (nudix superfamily)
MLKTLKRVPYAIVKRLPSSAKLVMNHLVATHFLVGLVAVVLNERGEFLVFEHTYRKKLPHGLPAGWLKKNESVHDAMAREIEEESGFQVEFVRILQTQTRRPPRTLDIWLLYRYAGGSFRASGEVRAAHWVTLETAPPLHEDQEAFLTAHWNQLVASVTQ